MPIFFEKSIKESTTDLFDNVIIKKLTTEDETSRETIIGVLKQMQSLKPSDTFIFYVASHGIMEEGVYYLLTSNVGSLSTRKLIETSLNEVRN